MMILKGFFEDSVTNSKGSVQGFYKAFHWILQGLFRIWKGLLQRFLLFFGEFERDLKGGLNKEL